MRVSWQGHDLFVDGRRRAYIRRSHGNWLAVVLFKNGNPKHGEYFPYGEPGSLTRAKTWCETKSQ